jgi:SanA protein
MTDRLHLAMRFFLIAFAGATLLMASVLVIGYIGRGVSTAWADAYIPADVDDLPTVDAAIVLGTAPYGVRGQRFRTLSYRLKAAADLWSAGKARYLIVSGNRIGTTYDEPTRMRDGLAALGVPPEFVYRDFGGIRTWDSMVRARDIYGLHRTIVVSERDHLARALLIGRHIGLDAWGYPANGLTYTGLRGHITGDLALLRAYSDIVVDRKIRPGRRVAVGVDPPD